MQLRHARLCLDCEEIHGEPHCPICASEAFTYVTRWVPAADRRPAGIKRTPAAPEPRAPRRVGRLLTGGALGLAVLATARWLLRGPDEEQTPSSARSERRSSW